MTDHLLHPSLRWRALGEGDGAALAQLLNEVFEADGLPMRTSEADALHELGRPGIDPARDSIAGFDSHGRMLARGLVSARAQAGAQVRVFLEGDVHPSARGRGVGAALLRWLEGRATERLRELERGVDRGVPRLIATHYADGDAHRASLQAAAGFVPMRWFAEMLRPLDQPLPAAHVPEGIELLPWTTERNEDTRDAHNDAFRDHWGSSPVSHEEWRHQHADAASFRPELSRVAVDRGAVVAYAACHRYPEDDAATGRSSVWLETIGVRRAYRRRGLASAVIVDVLAALRAARLDAAELGVDSSNPSGAFGLYERLGFRETRRWVFTGKQLEPG